MQIHPTIRTAALIASIGVSGCGAVTKDAGGNGTGPPAPSCPPDVAVNGAECPAPIRANPPAAELTCSWGSHPDWACRTTGVCQPSGVSTSLAWSVTPPPAQCSDPLLPPECPSSPPSGSCESLARTVGCIYPDGTGCACTQCSHYPPGPYCGDSPEGSWLWECAAPSSVPGCNPFPNEGTPCNLPSGTSCGISGSGGGEEATCQNGVWVWQMVYGGFCADPETPIATPFGERPIASLASGDLVYSVDHDAIVAVPIVRVGRRKVVAHSMVHVTLSDGRELSISPAHPTADGRTFGQLRAGDLLDGHSIAAARREPYGHAFTYDILPESETGTYFAAGLLVGSTLAHAIGPIDAPR